jgi:hypothetical protein
MQLNRLLAATLFLCLPAVAHATEDSAPAPAAQAEASATADVPAEAEKPKKICRMETGTGSVMPRRVCRTPEQVAADQEAARRTREQMNRNRGM